MNHGLLSGRTRALVAAGLVLALAIPASAKDLIDGLITYGNSANLRYDCTTPDPGYLSYSHNDLSVAPLAGWTPVFPGFDFQPSGASIAAGTVDAVATIAYADADTCNSCGAARLFDQACFRGGIDPNGVDWTAGWTIHGDLADPKPADWATRNLVFLAGPQPTSHWTAPNLYVLQGKVSFPAGTTLTIQPGTLVVGENATGGYLVIERDADIVANGTAALPIVMTTDLDPPVPGGWGGLVIHGKAVANCADCLGGASCISEGGAGSHCGTNDCDSSGSLSYIICAYSGIEISPDNELNSFTFNSVGSGTTAHHLQAHEGTDDLFEWFGGHMNAQYLLGTGSGDDGLDWQMGFRGTIQYAVIQQYPVPCDKGIEADNNEFNFDAPCRSNPLLANITLIGSKDVGSTGTYGAHFRRGTDVQMFNSIIVNFNNQAIRVENDATCAGGLNPQTATLCGPAVDAPVVATSSDLALRAFPNPAVAGTNFQFSLPSSGRATLEVFDVTGRRVANVLDGVQMDAGRHDIAWNPSATLPAGTYFFRLQAGASPSMGRLVVVR